MLTVRFAVLTETLRSANPTVMPEILTPDFAASVTTTLLPGVKPATSLQYPSTLAGPACTETAHPPQR